MRLIIVALILSQSTFAASRHCQHLLRLPAKKAVTMAYRTQSMDIYADMPSGNYLLLKNPTRELILEALALKPSAQTIQLVDQIVDFALKGDLNVAVVVPNKRKQFAGAVSPVDEAFAHATSEKLKQSSPRPVLVLDPRALTLSTIRHELVHVEDHINEIPQLVDEEFRKIEALMPKREHVNDGIRRLTLRYIMEHRAHDSAAQSEDERIVANAELAQTLHSLSLFVTLRQARAVSAIIRKLTLHHSTWIVPPTGNEIFKFKGRRLDQTEFELF